MLVWFIPILIILGPNLALYIYFRWRRNIRFEGLRKFASENSFTFELADSGATPIPLQRISFPLHLIDPEIPSQGASDTILNFLSSNPLRRFYWIMYADRAFSKWYILDFRAKGWMATANGRFGGIRTLVIKYSPDGDIPRFAIDSKGLASSLR